jgi:N,N'-diacetyllegionaminate synthase
MFSTCMQQNRSIEIKPMRIGTFDTDRKVFIIAEIGNNHEGSYSRAEELIGRAAEAGADAVKFQTIVPELLVASELPERIAQLIRICLPLDDFARLKKAAEDAGVLFLSTPFDLTGVSVLSPLVAAYKISSADNNFFPLLEAVAATGKPVILSTGLADLAILKAAHDCIHRCWSAIDHAGDLAFLHCVSSYPTPHAEANLLAIRQLAEWDVTVGYSDHTLGIEAAVASVALGARIVEKHFTLDKYSSDFRDHQLSADPSELSDMVRRIRHCEIMLGSGKKQLMDCEASVAIQGRRSAFAALDLPEGSVLGGDDVLWQRPGGGIPPSRASDLVGRRLKRPLRRGERIEPSALKG